MALRTIEIYKDGGELLHLQQFDTEVELELGEKVELADSLVDAAIAATGFTSLRVEVS